jgi:hypothetical protein|eukprot:COSAG01_NODE_12538_length_1723_cov_1.294335_1_plen_181_part_00
MPRSRHKIQSYDQGLSPALRKCRTGTYVCVYMCETHSYYRIMHCAGLRWFWTNFPDPPRARTPSPQPRHALLCHSGVPRCDTRQKFNCLTTGVGTTFCDTINNFLTNQRIFNKRNGYNDAEPNLSKDQWKDIKLYNLVWDENEEGKSECSWRMRVLTTKERANIMGFPPVSVLDLPYLLR